eukprot:GILJ01001815.1.p1 GENE.GILJ01001815.1~~GILJ01001815.1.p1  ORF type:complete len:487 (-),score=99.71 GILJ01001815.1:83-1543(-)
MAESSSRRLFIGNIPFTATTESLSSFFADQGLKTVQNVTVAGDRSSGRSRGFAFINVDLAEEMKALSINGAELESRPLKVAVATSTSTPRERPARTGAESEGAEKPKRRRNKRRTSKPAGETDASPSASPVANGDANAEGAPIATKPKNKRRRNRKPKKSTDGTEGAAPEGTAEERKPRERKPRQPRQPKTAEEGQEGTPKEPREPRAPRVRKPAAPLVVSLKSTVPLVDIGANLCNKAFKKDLSAVIERAQEAGVKTMLLTGSSIDVTKESIALCQAHPGLFKCTAGVHPHHAKDFTADSIAALEQLASDPSVVAIGETGLDFNRNLSPREAQLDCFEKQVELACRLKKPLFVHERDAHADVVAILDKFAGRLPPVVIHCFTGTEEELTAYLAKGYFIGLTGFVGKKKRGEAVRGFLNKLPLEKMMLETDCPYMLGDDSRTDAFRSRNEPCTLPHVVEVIANTLGVPMETVATATTKTSSKFFGL